MLRACALLIACALACATACRSAKPSQKERPHLTLSPLKGTEYNAPIKCLAQYAYKDLEPSDIERLISEGMTKCFPSEDQSIYDGDLPVRMGTDSRNKEEVEVNFLCSDLCPNAGYPLVIYSNVLSEERCCSIGGGHWMDRAWGGWFACVPPETPPQQGMRIPSCP